VLEDRLTALRSTIDSRSTNNGSLHAIQTPSLSSSQSTYVFEQPANITSVKALSMPRADRDIVNDTQVVSVPEPQPETVSTREFEIDVAANTIADQPTQSSPFFEVADSDEELWNPVEAEQSKLAASNAYDDDDDEIEVVPPMTLIPRSTNNVNLTAHPYYPEVMRALKSVFGHDKFRKNQLEAIIATLEGRDVVKLMPTGGGKSLCYQLPAILKCGKTRGVTFVISPLLSLMDDQMRGLERLKIDAVSVTGDQSSQVYNTMIQRLLVEPDKLPSIACVTPERLDEKTGKFMEILQRLYREEHLARFVIDEAHLIPDWGRSFREAVRSISPIRRLGNQSA
jgi:superfamily II DNA helicase RecQ